MSQNTTATGGYILPAPETPALQTIPPNLTLKQFIQTVLVGISGFDGTLVRPSWQVNPPKQPDIGVDWLAYAVESAEPDFNAYVGYDPDNNPFLQRNELLQIAISVYGPNAYDNYGLIRDGFQMQQNLSQLAVAKMGFAYDTRATHAPDFFGERWIERWRFEIFLRRQIQRTYPVLSFISGSGTIYAQTAKNENYQKAWASGE